MEEKKSQEYIDRAKVLDELQKRYEAALSWYENVSDPDLKIRAEQAVASFLESILTIKNQAAADVQEVKHGRWIPIKKRICHCNQFDDIIEEVVISYCCSECGTEEKNRYFYCPNCGAKMDGKDEEND